MNIEFVDTLGYPQPANVRLRLHRTARPSLPSPNPSEPQAQQIKNDVPPALDGSFQ